MQRRRLAFQEVASRFSQQARSHNPATYQISAHVGDETAASSSRSPALTDGPTYGQPTPRQPSRRPIDRRWDQSRGIVFHKPKRSAMRDHSWSPIPIVAFSFCEVPSIQRLYSSKATPTPPRKPNFGGSGPGGPTAAKPLARVMGPPAERSLGDSLDREQEYRKGQEAIRELEAVNAKLQNVQNQLATANAALDSSKKVMESLKKTHDYLLKGKEEEIKLKEGEIRRIEQGREEYAMKLVSDSIHKTQKAEQENSARAVEAVRQGMAVQLEKAQNRPVAAEAMAQDEREKANAERRRASRAMNAVERLEARNNTLQQEIEELKSQTDVDKRIIRTEGEDKARRLTVKYDRDVKIAANEAAARPLQRSDYGQYKALYEELRYELSGLYRACRDVAEGCKAQIAYWETAQKTFEAFCEKQSKSWLVSRYPRLLARIGKLPQASMNRANEVVREVGTLRGNIENANDTFQWAAHDHRTLVRNVRFQNSGDYGDASSSAHTLGHLHPWQSIADLAASEASQTSHKKAVSQYFKKNDSVLRRRRLLAKLVAIRHDDIGAKAVFLETEHHGNTYRGVGMIRAVLLAQFDRGRGSPTLKKLSVAIEGVDKVLEGSKHDSMLYADRVRREAMVKGSLGGADADALEKKYDFQLDTLIRARKRDIREMALALTNVPKNLALKPVAMPSHMSTPRRQRQAAGRTVRPKKIFSKHTTFKPTAALQASHVITLPGNLLPKQHEVTVNMALLPDYARNSPFGRSPRHPLMHVRPFTTVADSSDRPLAYGTNQAHSPHQLTPLIPGTRNAPLDQPAAQSDSSSDMDSSTMKSADNAELDLIEQHQTLSYQIPAEDFKSAITASENTSAAYWKHTLYKGPEGQAPRYHYCTSFETAETQAKQFLNKPVLGFDIEWETWAKLDGSSGSSIKDNVSLIQIAAEDKIGLFHIARFKGSSADELMPPSLRHVLESPRIIKAGVNVVGDATRLRKCLDTEMQGLFELSHLYKVVMFSENESHKVNRVPFSLAKQVQAVLHLPLKKGEVRTSSWSKRLNLEQCLYAASDAYAGFRLFDALEAKRKLMRPTPPRPAYYELHQPLLLGNGKKVMPRPRTNKPAAAGKAAETDEEEDEEFFDAVETQEDAPEEDSFAGVPLSGITYPTLPLLESLSINESAHSSNAAASSSASDNNSGNSARSILPSSPASKLPLTSTPRVPIPYTPEAATAEAWATTYRAEPSNSMTTPANLRAYHLWHHQQKSVPEIAAILRETPLSTQTVASYIMQALKEAKLPCEVERTKEVLEILPGSVRWRYNAVVRRLEE